MYSQQIPHPVPTTQPLRAVQATDLKLAGSDGIVDPQAIASATIHLPDSIQPDDRACSLQSFDLTTPDCNLPSSWLSDLPPADVQSSVLSQGLDAWLLYDHPADVALVADETALHSQNAASLAIQPERFMSDRPGDLSDEVLDALQDYQQAASQSYPQSWEDQSHAFSHRALRLSLLDDGLGQ